LERKKEKKKITALHTLERTEARSKRVSKRTEKHFPKKGQFVTN
jgi:hypothetical protein